MTNYTELPITLINSYIWDLAKGNVSGEPAVSSAVWNTSAYKYRPIYPIAENMAPESKTTPYILYDFIYQNKKNTSFYAIYREEATYTIVGEVPQIFYLKNFIMTNLANMDETAFAINSHSNSTIDFKWVDCYQDDFVLDEKKIESYKPKYITTLKICYEYTK